MKLSPIDVDISWQVRLAGTIALVYLCASCSLTGGKKSKLEEVLQPDKIVARTGDPNVRIGAREHPKILAANGGVYQNRGLDALLANISSTLTKHVSQQHPRYQITVLNSPSVNAFALPGGYLYVTRGLLALANNSAEVAAVLAHEMAHVSANHGIERSRKLEASKLADRVVLDVLSNDRAGKIALAANKINLAKFSQNQELQADSLGIKMIGQAGYDAFAAARFLEAMNVHARYQSSLSNNDDGSDFLATHPSTPRRIELAKRHARYFGAPGSGIRNRDAFLTGITGILFGDSAREGFVRGNRFSHAGLGITFRVPSGYEISNKADAVVIGGPNQIAVRFDGISQPGNVTLSQYLQSGWVNGLDAASIKKTIINGLDAATGSALADGWRFEITLIRTGQQIYRFILAAPVAETNSPSIARRIAGTFRQLTAIEKSRLRPLKLTIVKVEAGDSVASLSSRMQGTPRKLALFRLLNGLQAGERLKSGQKVKLVGGN